MIVDAGHMKSFIYDAKIDSCSQQNDYEVKANFTMEELSTSNSSGNVL